MKKKKILILTVSIVFIIVGCQSNHEITSKSFRIFDEFSIVIRTNGHCVHEINLDIDGKGSQLFGITNSDFDAKNYTMDSVIMMETFKINSRSEKFKEIKEHLQKIKSEDKQQSGHQWDAARWHLYIDNEEYIDIFGLGNSSSLENTFNILVQELPFELNPC